MNNRIQDYCGNTPGFMSQRIFKNPSTMDPTYEWGAWPASTIRLLLFIWNSTNTIQAEEKNLERNHFREKNM